MPFTVQIESPPFREDASGAVRIGESRVLLELVIRAFQDGATPEAITQRYSTASLSDIYAAIAYYLRHRDEVEAYLTWREEQSREVQNRLAVEQSDWSDFRARLMARRHA